MVFISADLSKWKKYELKTYLLLRGVPLCSGSARKALLIKKVIMPEALNLPLLPTTDNRINEINNSQSSKLFVGDILHLPFPEDLKSNRQSGSQYLPNTTLEIIKEYATNKSAMKAFREGKNLQYSEHVKDVSFNKLVNSIWYCYDRATVVPQTKLNKNPYLVWVCFYGSELVFTAECSRISGFSSSCKHVFSLLHYIENEVRLGHNKTCIGKNNNRM
ncbi:uncharacterized protein LOC124811194 [Hydra vulgaris]|uniref:uncharacterized protein LOC124811194 n=1 Tax=Hydra vulgaris TaxID=6087 RepID=UPI001F5E931C|nr:uncharacterized protein LOC124811194 [Hydra vulgaris]